MIRIILVSLALLAVPFVIYFLYELARGGPDGTGARRPKDWERDSVLNLGFVGLFLVFAGIVTVLVLGSGSRDGKYVPARIENGKLIDGGFNASGDTLEQSVGAE